MTPTDPFPDNLRRIRAQRGMTQQQLAAKIGKREKDISRWELGKNEPDWSSVRQIAAALDVPLDDLAAEIDAAADAGSKRARRDRRPRQ